MVFRFIMKFDNFLKLLCITLLFLYACTSNQLTNTADSCIIFDEKKSWYKATKNSYDKWNTPIAFQLAVIKQESSFTQFAKPKRKKFLGLIPTSRPSTAFGYAQITNPTSGKVELKGRIASLLEVGTGFHPELTGRENIYLNGAINGMSQKEVKQKLDEIVDFEEINED